MDVALVVGDRRRHSCGDGPGRVSGMGSRDPCARPPARARGSRSGHHGGRGDRGPAPSRHRRRVRGPGCGRAGCRPWISHPHAAVAAGPDLPSGAPAGLGCSWCSRRGTERPRRHRDRDTNGRSRLQSNEPSYTAGSATRATRPRTAGPAHSTQAPERRAAARLTAYAARARASATKRCPTGETFVS